MRRLVAATADAARSPLVLACSGGADSTALMLLAADAFGRGRLRVAHVHHGLQADADAWLAHVAGQAALLGLAFEGRRLAGAAAASRRFDGLGPEGWARQERYLALTAIARAAGAGAVLTAHHLHDQIETAMLQSARGAGRSGRSAMAAARPLGTPAPWLLRPLLDVPRERLRAVVARAGWDAVDDPSNTDPARTRTAIRSRVTAALAADVQSASRWLAAIAADRAAEARDRAQAALDLHEVRFPAVTTVAPGQFTGEVAGQVVGKVPGEAAAEVAEQGAGQVVGKVAGQRAPRWLLSRERLARFDAPRRAALWRLWLEQAGRRPPTRARLAEIDRQMVAAASTQAVVGHAGLLIVRHRDRIGLLSRLPEPLPVATRGIGDPASAGSASAGSASAGSVADAREPDCRRPFQCESSAVSPPFPCWRIALDGDPPASIVIGPGRARDRLSLQPQAPSHRLRTLWQEAGIPAWLRAALPTVRDARTGRLLAAFPFGIESSNSPEAGLDVEPAAGETIPDERTAGEPTADEPTADEPTADEPTADEPTADEPTAIVPAAVGLIPADRSSVGPAAHAVVGLERRRGRWYVCWRPPDDWLPWLGDVSRRSRCVPPI
ncbi:MAG: tRNA lysidine(34) synthetase TilS [Burkholderiaceae bacterium]